MEYDAVWWKFIHVSKESATSNVYRLTTMSCYPDNMQVSANFIFFCSLIDTRNYNTQQWTLVSVSTRKKTNQVCDNFHEGFGQVASTKHISAMTTYTLQAGA